MLIINFIDIKTGQYSLHFARNESVRVYYYNQKTMVINAHEENKTYKSNYSSISIPLKFPAFQDCLEFQMDNNYNNINRSELVKASVGCHFVETKQANLTSLSFHNITLTENRTQQCIWSWTENANREHGGVFNITMKQMQQPVMVTHSTSGSIPEVFKPVYTDVMLALTCDACFERPCIGPNKNSRVTFAIPFILTNKTYIIEHCQPRNPSLSIIILAASISFVIFICIVIITYQCIKRSRDKRYVFTIIV